MTMVRRALLESFYYAARSFFFHQRTGKFWDESETKDSVLELMFLSLLSVQQYLAKTESRNPTFDYNGKTGIVTLTFMAGKWGPDPQYLSLLSLPGDSSTEHVMGELYDQMD
jgi:hypothetical protein